MKLLENIEKPALYIVDHAKEIESQFSITNKKDAGLSNNRQWL